MTVKNAPGFINAIGNTPLIKLHGVSELTGCDIFGKAEFMNPGGSVKDRAAKAIVEDAEARGLLGPGGLIVEGTAGNTGIGLTMVGNAKGYKSVIVMPETQSEEKKMFCGYAALICGLSQPPHTKTPEIMCAILNGWPQSLPKPMMAV